jgi:hypothetical protein
MSKSKPQLASRVCNFPKCEAIFQPKSPAAKFCSVKHEVVCLCGAVYPTSSYTPRASCRKCSQARRTNTILKLHQDPAKSKAIRQKTEATNRLKYGVNRPLQSTEIQKKFRATNNARHGVDYPMQNKSILAKAQATNIQKFGFSAAAKNETVKNKTKRTNIARYGVSHPMKREIVRKKLEATMQEIYGVKNAAQHKDIRNKAFLEKFGGASPMADPKVQEQVRNTLLERYGVDNPAKIPEVQERIKATLARNINEGKSHHSRVSKINLKLKEELTQKFQRDFKLETPFGKYSADLSNNNLLIDVNPTVSHNSAKSFQCFISNCIQPCLVHQPREKHYHFYRAIAAQHENKTLIQIYDWDNHQSIFDMLARHLDQSFTEIHARKIKLLRITSHEANQFLNENHILGGVNGQSSCWGIFSNVDNQLLAVAAFGATRLESKTQWEFLRYSVKKNIIIDGAASRLWRAFVESEDPLSVVSYLDFNHVTQKDIFLNNLGFKELKPTGPTLIWHHMVLRKKVTQTSLVKLGTDNLLETHYAPPLPRELDSQQIMLLEGFLPVWTAGKRIFQWDSCIPPSPVI